MPAHAIAHQTSPTVVGLNFPALDGLRAFAVTSVVIFHCRRVDSPGSAAETLYYRIVDAGWIGVDLFFVLSGFLITGILLDTCAQQGYYTNFYMRRALRILPLYYGMLVVVVALALTTTAPVVHSPSTAVSLSYWLYLQNWIFLFDRQPIELVSHFWSLAIEEQFYIFWPALVAFAAARDRVGTLCVAALAISVATRIAFVHWHQLAYFFTISRMDSLAAGALLAVYLRRRGSFAALRRPARVAAVASLAALVIVTHLGRGFYGHDPVVLLYGLLPLAILFASVVALTLTARRTGVWRRVTEHAAVRYIGKVSYGIYVYHYPVLLGLLLVWPKNALGFWGNQLGISAAVALCTFAVATISYEYYERPFLALKRKYAPIVGADVTTDVARTSESESTFGTAKR